MHVKYSIFFSPHADSHPVTASHKPISASLAATTQMADQLLGKEYNVIILHNDSYSLNMNKNYSWLYYYEEVFYCICLSDEGDQIDITTYLTPLDRTTVYILGQVLGLTQWKAKNMRESDIFLDEVIAAWLRREDHVEKKGIPTWRTLVKALRHQRIGQNGLANDISRDKGL